MVAKPGRPTVSSSNPDADLTTRPLIATLKASLNKLTTQRRECHLAVNKEEGLKDNESHFALD
jgi:hypothetical protein